MRHRRLGNEERPGDLGCAEPGDQPQRQSHLSLGRERGVTAGEDEAQTVVLHCVKLPRFGLRVKQERLRLPAVTRRLAPEAVQRLVAGCRDDPATRVRRHACLAPTLGGDDERLLDRLLGHVDVTEEADQVGHGAAGLLAEGELDGGRVRFWHA